MAKFIKKPLVLVGGSVVFLILILILLLGRGGGQDPAIKSVKNLSNRHQSLISVIDSYSGGVKSGNFKSNLSQVSIILTADKNDVDAYLAGLIKNKKSKVVATVNVKPSKDVVARLDQAKISNNLDSELKSVVRSGLLEINSDIEAMKKSNAGEAGLTSLADKLILNTQTMLTTIDESR